MPQEKTVNCPGCGGEIPLATASVRVVHCSYCNALTVVNEEAIRALGKVALLSTSDSCLGVGWRARCGKRELEVLGRIQYQYSAGLWDEWWVRFLHDGSEAWISQDEGKYILQRPLPMDKIDPPDYEQIQPGDEFHIGKHKLWVQEKDRGQVVGTQGQLPHFVERDSVMRYLNLTNNSNLVSFEYYPDGEIAAYKGHILKPNELERLEGVEGWATTQTYTPPTLRHPQREDDVVVAGEAVEPKKLQCPSCGGACEIRDQTGTVVLTCQYCKSVLDVSVDGLPKILCEAQKRKLEPVLPMGSRCKFKGHEWTVIGRVRYQQLDDSGIYVWDSYQLYCPGREYLFLELENGHWLLFERLKHRINVRARIANPGQKINLMGQRYKVMERSLCKITYVEGELSWVARLDDVVHYLDAIRPPCLVSAEWTETEMEWSFGKYKTREEVADAFGWKPRKLPQPRGIAPAQPFERSRDASFCMKTGLGFAIVTAMAFCYALFFTGGEKILQTPPISSASYLASDGYVSDPFEIPEGSHICKLHARGTSLNNAWVAMSIAVLNEDEEIVAGTDSTVEYYSGYEGGESWSEGSRTDYKLFRLKGPATYRLNIFGEAGQWSKHGGSVKTSSGSNVILQLYRDVTPARYFLYAMIFSLLFPVWELIRYLRFQGAKAPETDD